jgi:hypothetical protein
MLETATASNESRAQQSTALPALKPARNPVR